MKLQDLISQTYTVIGHGRWLRTQEHDSLVIDAEKQVFFWNSRDIIGNEYVWLTKVLGMSHREANEFIEDTKDNLLSKISTADTKDDVVVYPALVEIFYETGKGYREYWRDVRGYTDETIERFRLGFTGEWYVIPIFVDGSFKNFQCRKPNPKRVMSWYKGLGPLPFNFSSLAVTNWTVLTEGPVDAIMLRQYDIPAVSQTGAAGYWNSTWMDKFFDIERIYICYDNNVAGNLGAKKVTDILGVHRSKIYNFWDFEEGFDVTDFFKRGGTKDNFMELLEKKSAYEWEVQ